MWDCVGPGTRREDVPLQRGWGRGQGRAFAAPGTFRTRPRSMEWHPEFFKFSQGTHATPCDATMGKHHTLRDHHEKTKDFKVWGGGSNRDWLRGEHGREIGRAHV